MMEMAANANVDDIKRRIHSELFAKTASSDSSKKIEEIKESWREETLLSAIRIMRNHDQSEDAIREMLERKFLLDEDVISEVLKKEEKSRTREGDRMDIAEIQKKVGHDSKGIGSDEGKFQLSRAIFVKSAMICKNHGKSDEEITAMLEKDFMLNEDRIKLIMDEIADCNDSKKDS